MRTIKNENEKKQRLDYDWFMENRESLYNRYGKSYLAIKNKKVLASYGSFEEAVITTRATEDIGTFIVQECAASEEEMTNYIMSVGLTVI